MRPRPIALERNILRTHGRLHTLRVWHRRTQRPLCLATMKHSQLLRQFPPGQWTDPEVAQAADTRVFRWSCCHPSVSEKMGVALPGLCAPKRSVVEACIERRHHPRSISSSSSHVSIRSRTPRSDRSHLLSTRLAWRRNVLEACHTRTCRQCFRPLRWHANGVWSTVNTVEERRLVYSTKDCAVGALTLSRYFK